MGINKALYVLLAGMVLAACTRQEEPADWASEASVAVDEQTAQTVADTAQDAAEEAATATASGKSEEASDDRPGTVTPGKLYTLHDDEWNVTCWYILGDGGSWTLSCLPDSAIGRTNTLAPTETPTPEPVDDSVVEEDPNV